MGGGTVSTSEEEIRYLDGLDEGQYTVEGTTIVYTDYTLTFDYLDEDEDGVNDAVEITGIQDIEGDTNVTIPESIEVGEETLPVTTIGEKAFYMCISLEEINLSNVTSIWGGGI